MASEFDGLSTRLRNILTVYGCRNLGDVVRCRPENYWRTLTNGMGRRTFNELQVALEEHGYQWPPVGKTPIEPDRMEKLEQRIAKLEGHVGSLWETFRKLRKDMDVLIIGMHRATWPKAQPGYQGGTGYAPPENAAGNGRDEEEPGRAGNGAAVAALPPPAGGGRDEDAADR